MKNKTNTFTELAGAWELVSGSYVDGDGKTIDYTGADMISLKVLSEGKFSFVSHAKGAFYAAGAGDYMAQNGLYIETPALASYPDMIGQPFEFQYQLVVDTWTNSRWKDGVRVEYEVWLRIKKNE